MYVHSRSKKLRKKIIYQKEFEEIIFEYYILRKCSHILVNIYINGKKIQDYRAK